jgi:MinD-like ATPase involved in chromosome partitioning or flagellar assembly
MSERQPKSGSASRLSSAAPPPAIRRVRVMQSGRWHAPITTHRARQLVVIASARPGAGKSVVAANLAAAIAALGQRVVLADLDPRTPRQHALLGLPLPERALDAWVQEKRQTRDQPPVPSRVRNLKVLPYAGARRPDEATARRAVVRELFDLDGDIVVVDIGSDNRDDVYDFFATRALRLLVTGGDRAGLESSYAFLESAARRAERRHGERAAETLAAFAGGLVGNWIESPEQAETFHAFARLVREHLGIPLPVAGCLQVSDRIPQSVAAGQPLVARRGVDDNVRAFHRMAEWVLAEAAGPVRHCDLDGGTELGDIIAPHPLPAEVGAYARRNPRYPVDWAATLELAGGVTAVRVLDLSASGAGIETTLALRIGDRGVLHFDQLAGKPALPVLVKNVSPGLRRLGLGFAKPGPAVQRLVAAAARTRAAK